MKIYIDIKPLAAFRELVLDDGGAPGKYDFRVSGSAITPLVFVYTELEYKKNMALEFNDMHACAAKQTHNTRLRLLREVFMCRSAGYCTIRKYRRASLVEPCFVICKECSSS